jgi:hypothetical protein
MKVWPVVREMLLFLGGMVGVGFEAIAKHTERPVLLAVYAVMMGMPIAIPMVRRTDTDAPGH